MESNGDNLSMRVASFSYYLDTAKENLVERISPQDPNLFLLSPGKLISNSAKPPLISNSNEEDLKNLRVDSFSYLNKAGANFVFKVPNPINNDPTNAFSFPPHQIPKDNNEISVFGADKYFKMKLEYDNQRPFVKLPNPTLSSIGTGTPSLCSEASSLSSQTALLARNGSHSQTKQIKALATRFFTGFGCQPHCFDRKGVHVNHVVTPASSQMGSRRMINQHASVAVVPSTGTGSSTTTIMKQIKKADHHFGEPEKAVLEEPRNSIEVFGSDTTIKDEVAKKMERKLSMLTWDAIIPKLAQNQLPTSSSTICDDMASDASSDLFEIEHISGSLQPALSKPEVADDVSSCMSPQSHYAPSEASIQWSVVTGGAADYSSVLNSEYNDEMSASVAGDVIARNKNLCSRNAKTRSGGAKLETQKSPRVGLLGCKSLKAVDVAENVSHKAANEKVKNHGGRVQDIGTRDLPLLMVGFDHPSSTSAF